MKIYANNVRDTAIPFIGFIQFSIKVCKYLLRNFEIYGEAREFSPRC